MKKCDNCLKNNWKFIYKNKKIIAICQYCKYEIEFRERKKSKKKNTECLNVKIQNDKIKKLYIDGGCSANYQKDISLRKMISVVTNGNGKVLVEKFGDGGSNNIAEFIALEEAMKYCVENNIKKVSIITDSKNNISWFNYKFKKVKKINDFPRTLKIQDNIFALKEKVKVNIKWVGRNKNKAGIYIEKTHKL